MENDIEAQEEALFEEWRARLCKRMDARVVEELFCPDGLHFTGEAVKPQRCWEMKRDGREQELWNRSWIRPLFLTKDHNMQEDGCGVDVRLETGYDNDTDRMYHRFYARYLMALYGLLHMDRQTLACPAFDEMASKEELLDWFQSAPVVRVNIKKIAGEKECPNELLEEYLDEDHDLLKRQVAIYKPNVIVCCHGDENSCVMEWLWSKEMYPDLRRCLYPEDYYQFVYYSPSAKVVVLHEWHCSYRYCKYRDFYSAVPQLAKFLKGQPSLCI